MGASGRAGVVLGETRLFALTLGLDFQAVLASDRLLLTPLLGIGLDGTWFTRVVHESAGAR